MTIDTSEYNHGLYVREMQERQWCVYGPPGCGKTTYVARQVALSVQRYGSDKVLVVSFTRAAAAELRARKIPVSADMIGTLHAICRRVLSINEIAELQVKQWNEYVRNNSKYHLTNDGIDPDDPDNRGNGEGDAIYQDINRMRARMVDERAWPMTLRQFWNMWKAFKAETGTFDFTDMIDICYKEVAKAPNDPKVIFADEAQDFTLLELSLIRKWGRHADFFMLIGDDDQCIYEFKGATPEAFLDPPPLEDHKRILQQSYRVPRAVQRLSQAWIAQVTRREPKLYLPRDVDGDVRRLQYTYKQGDRIVEDALEEYVSDGKTVMILGACGYHVDDVKRALRANAIPFHNPYRTKRRDWNPLSVSRGDSMADRILAYLAPRLRGPEIARLQGYWTGMELKKWVHAIRAAGVLLRGAKTEIESLGTNVPIPAQNLVKWFEIEALRAALDCDIDWYQNNLTSQYTTDSTKYIFEVIHRHGVSAVTNTPKVIIGTIHSVKGGEADIVYLFPDLSMPGFSNWRGTRLQRDTIIRQFYVGATRARETLIMCQPGSMAMNLRSTPPQAMTEEL